MRTFRSFGRLLDDAQSTQSAYPRSAPWNLGAQSLACCSSPTVGNPSVTNDRAARQRFRGDASDKKLDQRMDGLSRTMFIGMRDLLRDEPVVKEDEARR